MKIMERTVTLLVAGLLALALASCGDGSGLDDEEGLGSNNGVGPEAAFEERPAAGDSEEVVVGGFIIEGPNGREISIPEATIERPIL